MHNILSIDTSLNYCSVAILYNNFLDNEKKKCVKKQEKTILPIIKLILDRNKININKFNFISFSNGPGNFTGIRIGVSVAQGLSLPYNIPLIGVSTCCVLAEQAWRKYKIKKVIVCIEAGNNKFYWGKYLKNKNNFWIKKTELLLSTEKIKKEINSLNNKWYLIGCKKKIFKLIKNKYLKFIKIYTPNAKDLIPITIEKIKNKKQLSVKLKKINYLNNLIN